MNQYKQLDHLLESQNGLLRTEQAMSAGITKPVFYNYVHSKELERVAHGIYLSKDAWVDSMYLLHLRFSHAVFSHETALFFHDLTDREPLQYTVTVKTGYNPTNLKEEGVQVFTIKVELHEVGLTTLQTPFGHDVPVYDMEPVSYTHLDVYKRQVRWDGGSGSRRGLRHFRRAGHYGGGKEASGSHRRHPFPLKIHTRRLIMNRKTVLTIAGSDSSGGAGIQADLKTMTALGLYGMSVITALTAQNTTGVYSILDVEPEFVARQMDCVFQDIFPDAIKIGMVSRPDIILALSLIHI